MVTSSSVPMRYQAARRLAHEHGWREKALVYLTRGNELLVLEHSAEYAAAAGVQVPAGGVEPGETPEAAARRELFEETGLELGSRPVHLESHYWTTDEAPSRIRHYYWLSAPPDSPDAWSHQVSAGEEDQGMTFHLSFRALPDPGLTPGYGWEAALDGLLSMLEQV